MHQHTVPPPRAQRKGKGVMTGESSGVVSTEMVAATTTTAPPHRIVYRRDNGNDGGNPSTSRSVRSASTTTISSSSSSSVSSSTPATATAKTSSAAPAASSLPSQSSSPPSSSSPSPIYYFGYGPIVHPLVRKRRGIQTAQERAAILLEHRLTFAYGGVVNMVPQRGFQVHGILIRFDSGDDWAKFQEFDAGYNLDEVIVYPYLSEGTPPELVEDGSAVVTNDDDEDDDEDSRPVTAFTFVMKEFDGSKLDKVTASTIEKLPQERYLKLISAGMRAYNIDEDYIEDQIMSIPYSPKTKPEDFKTFPIHGTVPSGGGAMALASASSSPAAVAAGSNQRGQGLLRGCRYLRGRRRSGDTRGVLGNVPIITLRDYQDRLCRNAGPQQVYFVVGTKVIQVTPPFQPLNPCVVWLRQRAHGMTDMTLTVHKTVVDPDIPLAYTEDEVTPLHIAWCENHIIEYMEQGGIRGTQIYELVQTGSEHEDDRNLDGDNLDGEDAVGVATSGGPLTDRRGDDDAGRLPIVGPSLGRRLLGLCCIAGATPSHGAGNAVGRTNRRSSNNSGGSNGNRRVRPSINSSSNNNNNSSSRSTTNNSNNNQGGQSYYSSSELMRRNFPLADVDDDEGGGTIHMDDDIDDDQSSIGN